MNLDWVCGECSHGIEEHPKGRCNRTLPVCGQWFRCSCVEFVSLAVALA